MRGSGGVVLAVAALGALAALLMIVTEFLTVAAVDVASGSCEVINDANPDMADRCNLSGFERHGGGLLLLGAFTLFMAVGASVGRSRPAAIALVAAGVIVLAFALLADLPEAAETGSIGKNFEGAEGNPGLGLFTELLGGALALGAGALRLLSDRRR